MTKEELKIVKEAMYQYEMLKIQQLEETSQVEFHPSEAYKAKKAEIREMIRKNTIKRKPHIGKRKILILVAATLIFAVIATACTFGNKIKGFLVDFFDSFVTFDYIDDSLPSNKKYTLEFIPENYKEISKSTFKDSTKIEYSDDENLIYFMYYPTSYFYEFVDTQSAEFTLLNLDDKEIYYSMKNDLYAFYWVNDDASFYLSCDISIEWTDIEKMISSVSVIE